MALESLLSGLNPISAGLNVVGGLANIVGAYGQKKETEKQLNAAKQFAATQTLNLKSNYDELMQKAQGLPTYRSDTSLYERAQQEAEMAKRAASSGRLAGSDLRRDNARLSTANMIRTGQRGAMSATDLQTLALMGQTAENQAMRDIDIEEMRAMQQNQLQAQQNYLQSLGQTAQASARERGMEYQSQAERAGTILNLSKQRIEDTMNLDQQMFDTIQAKSAALQNAKSAIWSGWGGLASGIGGSMMQNQQANANMDMLKSIYGMGLTTKKQPNPAINFGQGLVPLQSSAISTPNPSFSLPILK